MKSILDPSFKYTPACATDIRRTFRKVRRALEEAGAAQRTLETIKVEVDSVVKVASHRWGSKK